MSKTSSTDENTRLLKALLAGDALREQRLTPEGLEVKLVIPLDRLDREALCDALALLLGGAA